jgi:hypothetical protein
MRRVVYRILFGIKFYILNPFPGKRGMAKLAFTLHKIHLQNVKVISMDDPSVARRAKGRIVDMTWDIPNVNISQAVCFGNLMSGFEGRDRSRGEMG